MDIGALRRNLVTGEKKILLPIFEWIFKNEELISKLAYLARYLMPLNLPPEALSISEVMNLFAQYEVSMEGFKESHQNYEFAVQEGKITRELRNDSAAIESEIENVKKRIERLQTRLDKVPQQELLLEAAKSLRIEKDQQKELQNQIDEQKQGLQRATVISDRLQKEYQNMRLATQGTSPQQMLDAITEETQVLEFMVKQKLPQELLLRQTEVQILQEVIDEPNITREYLNDLQYRIDSVNKEIQVMVEKKMNDKSQQNDALGLGPFRQQASLIARNKEAAAEQLDRLTRELNEIESQLKDKQQRLQETVGEVVLRGDELKQFVNTLKAKSNIYKQQRSELAAVKAEANDLMETLENLRKQDPSLAINDEDASSLEPMMSRSDSPVESRGMTELSRLVDGLTRAVLSAREKLAPMSQQLRPLRERIAELKDECDSKKQVCGLLVIYLHTFRTFASFCTLTKILFYEQRNLFTLTSTKCNLSNCYFMAMRRATKKKETIILRGELKVLARFIVHNVHLLRVRRELGLVCCVRKSKEANGKAKFLSSQAACVKRGVYLKPIYLTVESFNNLRPFNFRFSNKLIVHPCIPLKRSQNRYKIVLCV